MSTEQENFDDLLRSKLSGSEFAFNEANWEKAEALIIAANKKRKRRILFFIFFIGLILGISVMIPFIGFEKVSIEKKDLSINEKDEEANKSTTEKTNVKNENITETKNVKSKENKITQINTLENNVVSNDEKDETNKVSTSTKTEIKSGNRRKEISVVNNISVQENKTNKDVVSGKGQTKISKTAKTKIQAGRSEDAQNNVKHVSTSPNKNNQIKNSKEIKNDDLKSDSKNSNLNNAMEENNVISQKVDTADVLASTKNNVIKDSAIVLKDSITKAKVDSAITPTKKDTADKFKRVTFISIDAGANYSLGWSNTANKEAAGFNGIAGLSVTHFFTRKWSALLGIQYNSLAHLNYSTYTSNNTQYGFGYNETKTIITPTILRYLAIPVKVHYWLNDKNSLSLGLNTLFLLNTNSKVETGTRSDFVTPTATLTTKTGYRDGFTTFDLQPAISYRRKIYKAFSLSAEVYYGLIDIKNNAVFGLNKTEHNSGLKLTLSYNILHK